MGGNTLGRFGPQSNAFALPCSMALSSAQDLAFSCAGSDGCFI